MFSSDYGFIVDYLAEVLKELRKEDRTNEFSEFFNYQIPLLQEIKLQLQRPMQVYLK